MYQTLPAGIISNQIYSLDLLFIYGLFLVHILFVRGLTRLDEHHFRFIRKFYKIIVGFSIIYFVFTLFSPIWVPAFSHFALTSIYNLAVFIFPFTLIYFLFAIFSSLRRSPFVKFYLAASVIGLCLAIVFFFNNGFGFNIPNLDYSHLQIGILIVLFIIFIGLIFQLRAYFSSEKGKQVIPEASITIKREKELNYEKSIQVIENQSLTKREIEVIKAFANGFTYQEIAEAMFISPHTAKTHIKNIYQKLGINSKVEAVRWVMENEV